jgi:hypothetical protein
MPEIAASDPHGCEYGYPGNYWDFGSHIRDLM